MPVKPRWVKGQSGNPAGRKPNSVILREVIGDDGVRKFAENLKELGTKKKYSKAMEILADRLFPKALEDPVKISGYESAKSFDDKSELIMQAVTEGVISIGQGDRLMNTLRNQVTIHESTQLIKDVQELKEKVMGVKE